jgi:wyosine [tRNA(Phe)-imidazoG37] synthetase (radical SAM superfamily)
MIFGPVTSRRLGKSLGVNLLPGNCKVCNFNCVYCECGWTDYSGKVSLELPDREDVFQELEERLAELKNRGEAPDVITFAGNGEPTLNPDFPGIIDDTLLLRDRYFPAAGVAVLSNATTCGDPEIREALMKVDFNILKLDSALGTTIKLHNRPSANIEPKQLIENLAAYNGKVIIQTLFVRGIVDGEEIDNTTPEELFAWLEALEKIKPSEVMIYTISRDTPSGGNLVKVPVEELETIALMVEDMGIKAQVSG